MIYHLSQLFDPTTNPFANLLHYVSVRAIIAFLSSIIFAFIFGDWAIGILQKKFRSKVREWTPENHQQKNNTPTMGGLFILGLVLLNAFLWCNLSNPKVWIFLLGITSFGTIGFLDDWAKIKQHKGISARKKFLLQIATATIIMILWYMICPIDTRLCIPFFKNVMPQLGLFIIPWGVFIIVATSNAVNLTDGLDGLATGPLIFNFASFAWIAYLAGHVSFSHYLYIPFAGSAELAVLGTIFVGTLLGFLWYNTHPAEVFMGDVGSLSLGAGLALLALFARQELLLLIAGGIFVLETVSVILQVFSFKCFGKRIFRMAPIHHHFELMGWKETKVTVRFWIISIILCVLTFLTLKIR